MPQFLHDLADRELPANTFKAAFFDIDGTLLSLAGDYSPASARELARIRQRGVKTAVASGRPYFAARFVVDELGLADPGLFCTGAHLYAPALGETLARRPIAEALALRCLAALRSAGVYYELYTEADYFVEPRALASPELAEISRVHAQHMRCAPNVAELDSLVDGQGVIKLLAAVSRPGDHRRLVALERAFPALQFAYAAIAAHPDWLFVSIVAAEACKHAAFDALLDYYALDSSQVICFGDAQSDCVFLERAGLGVAMGQASDAVKACADLVTKPVWDDGVAYALARLIR